MDHTGRQGVEVVYPGLQPIFLWMDLAKAVVSLPKGEASETGSSLILLRTQEKEWGFLQREPKPSEEWRTQVNSLVQVQRLHLSSKMQSSAP